MTGSVEGARDLRGQRQKGARGGHDLPDTGRPPDHPLPGAFGSALCRLTEEQCGWLAMPPQQPPHEHVVPDLENALIHDDQPHGGSWRGDSRVGERLHEVTRADCIIARLAQGGAEEGPRPVISHNDKHARGRCVLRRRSHAGEEWEAGASYATLRSRVRPNPRMQLAGAVRPGLPFSSLRPN